LFVEGDYEIMEFGKKLADECGEVKGDECEKAHILMGCIQIKVIKASIKMKIFFFMYRYFLKYFY
jgi:hypothetical protein